MWIQLPFIWPHRLRFHLHDSGIHTTYRTVTSNTFEWSFSDCSSILHSPTKSSLIDLSFRWALSSNVKWINCALCPDRKFQITHWFSSNCLNRSKKWAIDSQSNLWLFERNRKDFRFISFSFIGSIRLSRLLLIINSFKWPMAYINNDHRKLSRFFVYNTRGAIKTKTRHQILELPG